MADAIDNAGDERTVTITHTVSAAGTDYKDETAAAVDVTVTDDDGEPTLSIDAPSVDGGRQQHRDDDLQGDPVTRRAASR